MALEVDEEQIVASVVNETETLVDLVKQDQQAEEAAAQANSLVRGLADHLTKRYGTVDAGMFLWPMGGVGLVLGDLNFGSSVLDCIEADFYNQMFILQHFLR